MRNDGRMNELNAQKSYEDIERRRQIQDNKVKQKLPAQQMEETVLISNMRREASFSGKKRRYYSVQLDMWYTCINLEV